MEASPIILSFDVEEHDRIEAAASLACAPHLREEYGRRMESTTRRLLDLLARYETRATFFIVGQIAEERSRLIQDIQAAGHEIASHGWDHQRVHRFTPAEFAEDLRKSKDALEHAAGVEVLGYRAPTFSIMRETGWAIDVLAECGYRYDSSIFPVRHDRYGINDAPRTPFMAMGERESILEIPPVTLRCLGYNVPVAGGGYFRLFPMKLLEAGVHQIQKFESSAAMLYFHPWEFDADQPRLPLSRLSRWRTYVGTKSSFARFERLLSRHRFERAIDVARWLERMELPEFRLLPSVEKVPVRRAA